MQAVEAAVRAGIVVVVSAGNVGRNPETGETGYAGITSPGNAPSAITVGAVRTQNTTRRTDDLMADYSSRGPTWYDAFAKPDVVAPGHRILAASDSTLKLYQDYPTLRGPNYNRGKQYLYLSGTSMAAAVTSGTVALLIESSKQRFGVKPSPNAVKAMLMADGLHDGRRQRRAVRHPHPGRRRAERRRRCWRSAPPSTRGGRSAARGRWPA